MPAVYVKAYVRRQKNDKVDATACCEAVQRHSMRFVALRSVENQAELMRHRARELLSGQRSLGLSGILCAGPVASSGLNEAFVEHDGELGLCLEPLARRHFPLSRGLAQDEEQQLHGGVIGWKMASGAHGAA